MTTIVSPPARAVLLTDVSWETYERLLADLADRSAPRLVFDHGSLEIMSPTAEHEELNRTIAMIVEVAAEEAQLDIRNLGSTTFRRQDLARGFEPDSCFYVQNVDRVRGHREIDLATDPPPDLVIEIDITSSSIEKLPIYAQIGVPEIWRYDGKALTIHGLADSTYVELERSRALPWLSAELLAELIEASKSTRRAAWLRAMRKRLASR